LQIYEKLNYFLLVFGKKNYFAKKYLQLLRLLCFLVWAPGNSCPKDPDCPPRRCCRAARGWGAEGVELAGTTLADSGRKRLRKALSGTRHLAQAKSQNQQKNWMLADTNRKKLPYFKNIFASLNYLTLRNFIILPRSDSAP
jgi:hypothetical protein